MKLCLIIILAYFVVAADTTESKNTKSATASNITTTLDSTISAINDTDTASNDTKPF